jgi:phosphatidylglycerol:prolipoprotein diacylglycerol transferase
MASGFLPIRGDGRATPRPASPQPTPSGASDHARAWVPVVPPMRRPPGRRKLVGGDISPGVGLTLPVGIDPTIIVVGPLQIGWHGVLTAVAVLLAVSMGTAALRRRGCPADAVETLPLWSLVGGVVGARLFHVLDRLPRFVADPLSALAFWEGGIAAYGGFVGGVAAGVLAARRRGLAVWPLLDAVAPAMLVGQAVGRLGCLSNGDAWGAPTRWGVGRRVRAPGRAAPARAARRADAPYPRYEIAGVLLLLFLVRLLGPRLPTGGRFLVVALGYALLRFVLTTVRQEPVVLAGLQEAQVVALITGALAGALLLRRFALVRGGDRGRAGP